MSDDLLQLTAELERLGVDFSEEISGLTAESEVRVAQARYLGRKGRVTELMKQLGRIDPAERPRLGAAVNLVKDAIEAATQARLQAIEGEARRQDLERRVDVTLPGRQRPPGHLHLLTSTLREIVGIFAHLGFEVAEGPQVETDFHNFEALNIPRDHPARDMQDTFYLGDQIVLRTHTSPVQVRTMLARRPPVKIIAPGFVFRRDDDPTHSPMFFQVEGLLVDQQVSFADLKGTLLCFVHLFFGPTIGLRFRPSFFPFTEPSAEVDIECIFCGGGGCRLCKQSGYIEIGGAGMVDPAVFEAVGYDPEAVTGFAFGMGVERIAMLRHGVPDIRLFYENDVRFLEQF